MSEIGIVESSLWNMYGHEMDKDTRKLKENGRLFWGAKLIIRDNDGFYNFYMFNKDQVKVKLDTDRKAVNYARKLDPVAKLQKNIYIWSQEKYDQYMAEYERVKSEEK